VKPILCPKYAWIDAAETAVIIGMDKPNFWSWSRRERTHILMAALDAVPEGLTHTENLSLESYQEVWEAAYAAALEVLAERKMKKRPERGQRN